MEYFLPGHRLCQGCGAGIIVRNVMKACKEFGIKPIVVCATGCLEVATTIYPYTSWNCPWIHVAFENAGAVASGVSRSVKILNKKFGKYNDNYRVIAFAGDGGTFDIGWQSLSGMLERGEDVLYICYDNEAYMNTGIQRSGATPRFASTTTTPFGKKERKKDIILSMISHRVSYFASASFSHYPDFYNKIKKALETKGPRVLHILSPCPTGWKFDPSLTVEVSRLAVETKVFPLTEWDGNSFKITYKPKEEIPVEEYLKLQGRFKYVLENLELLEQVKKDIEDYWKFLEKLEKAFK